MEVRYPPQKGYLSDTSAIPYQTRQNTCDTPLCDSISTGYCAICGGILHWAAKWLATRSRSGRSQGCGIADGRASHNQQGTQCLWREASYTMQSTNHLGPCEGEEGQIQYKVDWWRKPALRRHSGGDDQTRRIRDAEMTTRM